MSGWLDMQYLASGPRSALNQRLLELQTRLEGLLTGLLILRCLANLWMGAVETRFAGWHVEHVGCDISTDKTASEQVLTYQ